MEYRTLELTILSTENLKKVTHFSKTAAYVVVSVVDSSYNLNSVLHKHQTPVDKHGDKNPTWNYPVSFTVNDVALQQNRITFLFQVYTKRLFPVDKLIGEVRVPVSDMISSGGDGKQEVSTLAYQVRKSHGNPRGVLHIKCKIGEKFERVEPPPDRREPATAYPYAPPPPPHQSMWGRPAQGYYPPPQVQQAGYGYGGYGNGYGYGYGNGGGYGNGRMGGFGGMGGMGGGRNNFGMGLGAGLLGGALGGMLIGDMMSDAAYDGAYDGGFDGGFDDGGFDF